MPFDYDGTFHPCEYGIFMEYRTLDAVSDSCDLLGYRFETLDDAIEHLEGMTEYPFQAAGDGEFFVAIPEDRLPEGYSMMVYYADEINDYDRKNYAIAPAK